MAKGRGELFFVLPSPAKKVGKSADFCWVKSHPNGIPLSVILGLYGIMDGIIDGIMDGYMGSGWWLKTPSEKYDESTVPFITGNSSNP